jgi:hypothetical protein
MNLWLWIAILAAGSLPTAVLLYLKYRDRI